MPCPYITDDILYIHHITAFRKQYSNFLIRGEATVCCGWMLSIKENPGGAVAGNHRGCLWDVQRLLIVPLRHAPGIQLTLHFGDGGVHTGGLQAL